MGFVSFDAPAETSGSGFVDFSKPAEPRNLLKEVPIQAYAGATVDLPKQVGQAMQWMSEPGHAVYDQGKALQDWSSEREQAETDLAPQVEGRGLIGRALSTGARAIVPSTAIMVPAALGAMAAPAVGVGAVIGAGAGAATGAFGLFGASQAQDTYDKLQKAGVPESEAREAGWINLMIEGGGETVGTMAGLKLFGMMGKVMNKAASPVANAMATATDTAVLKPFLKQLPKTAATEIATEFGQNYGEAWIENKYGAPEVAGQSALEQGIHGAEAALGMTILLAPFGLAGFARRAKQNGRVADALQDPEAPVPERIAASKIMFNEINAVNPDAAKAWSQNSSFAIATNSPIVLDETMAGEGKYWGGEGQPATMLGAHAELANQRVAAVMAAETPDQAIQTALSAPAAVDLKVSTAAEMKFAQDGRQILEAMEKNAQLDAIAKQGNLARADEQLAIAEQPELPGETGQTAMQLAFAAAKARKGVGNAIPIESAGPGSVQRPAGPGNEVPGEAVAGRNAGLEAPAGAQAQAQEGNNRAPAAVIPTTAVEAAAMDPKHLEAARNLTRSQETRQVIDEELARRGRLDAVGATATKEQIVAGPQPNAAAPTAQAAAPQAPIIESAPVPQDQPAAEAPVGPVKASTPPVKINGQLPHEMTVTQLQHAAENAPYFDQKAAAEAELKVRDKKGETFLGRTVDQLGEKELTVASTKGKPAVKVAAKAEIEKRANQAAELATKLTEPDTVATLKALVNEAGWAERGGHLIRHKTGEAAGEEIITRTKWVPRAEWWPGRPVVENEQYYRAAVAKAIAGAKLTSKQTEVVKFLLAMAEDERAGMEVAPETSQDDAAAAQQLADETGDAPAGWATMTEEQQNDELDKLFGQDSRPAAEGAQARAPVAEGEVGPASAGTAEEVDAQDRNVADTGPVRETGVQGVAAGAEREDATLAGQPADRSALELRQQTPADLAAKAAQSAAEAAQRAAESVKQMADDLRASFALSGSTRAADVGAAAGQQDLLAAKPAADETTQVVAQSSDTKPVETFAGQYGKGLNQVPAKQAQQRLSREKPNLTWRVEKSEGLDNPFVVNGYAKSEERAQAIVADKSIDDFGEKIGGARKDTSQALGARIKADAEESAEPGWRKRFSISQIVSGSHLNETEGQWVIRDERKKDWMGKPRQIGQPFATEEAAEKAIPLLAVAQKHRAVPVGRTENGVQPYEIWRDVTDRKRVKVVDQQFATRDDAMRYMAEHAVDIIETKTGFGEEILAKPDKVKRTGAERRTGPATSQMFSDTFGFRGVEFGNWNNQDERQDVMNHAYDGLLDLAEVMNVPPKALSLNGELALAFGARGQGLSGAKAHYEMDYGVINLTKMTGAGSLAHEWFHALDHYLARQDTKAKSERVKNNRGDMVYPDVTPRLGFASHGFRTAGSQVRPELQKAYDALVQTMFTKAEQYVEDTVKAEKFVGGSRESLEKALSQIRGALTMGPEQLHYMKRNNKPASTEQLAAFDQLADRLVGGHDLETPYRPSPQSAGKKIGAPGWMAGRQTNDTLEAMSAIYKQVRGRSGFNAENGGTLDGLRYLMKNYRERIKMLESANSKETKTKRVPTSYAMENKKIDQGRASDYWTTEHEMAARAFSAYVEDKVAEQGNQSDFLAYGSDNKFYRLLGIRPFPEGAERLAINAAFDEFVGELQTKETDKGVAMFSRGEGVGMPAAGLRQTLAPALAKLKIKSTVHETIAEARAATGVDIPADAKAMYDKDELHFFAENIATPLEAETAHWHEVNHAGLNHLYGINSKSYEQALTRIAGQNQNIRAEASKWREKYGEEARERAKAFGMDDEKAARYVVLQSYDEALANLSGRNANISGLKQFLAVVQDFLRSIGLEHLADAMEGKTNAEALALIGRAREAVMVGDAHVLTGESAPAFAGPPLRDRTNIDTAMRRMAKMVDEAAAGRLKDSYEQILGPTPTVLQALGAPVLNLQIDGATVNKILTGKHKHTMTPDLLKQAMDGLYDPLAVFDSGKHTAAKTVLTNLLTRVGTPVIAAVHIEKKAGRYVVNDVASIYGLEDPAKVLMDMAPMLRYIRNESSLAPSTTPDPEINPRIEMAGVVQAARDSGANILTERDIVNRSGPAYSQPPAFSQGAAERLFSGVASSIKSAGFLNGVMSSPASLGIFNGINTQYHKAEMLARKGAPQFKAVFDRLQAYLNDINGLSVRAEQQAPGIFRELTGMGPKSLKAYFKGAAKESDIAAIGPWLFHGTLYGKGNPMEGVVWTDEQLRGKFEGLNRANPGLTPLNESQIPLYHQARAAIAQSLEDNAKAVIYRHVAKHGITVDKEMALNDVAQVARDQIDEKIEDLSLAEQGGDEKAAAQIADFKQMKETITGIEEKAAGLIEHGYMPLMRFGNRTVTAKDADGNVKFFGTYDGRPLVPGSANAEMVKVATNLRELHPEWRVTTGIKAENAWQLYNGMTLESLQNFLDFLDPETKAELERDATIQEYLKNAVNNRSVLKRLIHRTGMPGFSTDVPRSLASFITSSARNSSGMYHLGDAKKLVEDVPKEQGDVKDEAANLVKYVTEPGEEAAKLRGFLFFHFLGGSVAAAAVNLTQTVMMTLPYLAQHASVKAVTSAAIRASKMAVRDPASIEGEKGEFLQRAERAGITAPQQIHHLTATASNNPFSSNRQFRTFMTVWGGLFSAAEVFNRRVAFMAAYDIAKDNGLKGNAAYDFAAKTVTETQGLYNKGNRPNLSRGTIGALVFTFKTFSIMYLELLRRLPPQQQLLMLGVLLLAAGAEGLPFAEDIEDLVDTLGQWLGFTTNTGKWTGRKIRDTLGKEYERPILKGLGGMLPLDLHSRLGMQNLLPGTSFFKPSEIDKTRDVAEAVGPLGGVLQNLSQSLQLLARGKWDSAAVQAAPKAARDAFNGFHMATTGESIDTKGRVAMKDITGIEALGKTIGFNPQRAAVESEAKRELTQDKNLRTVRMDEFASDIADAIIRKDQESRQTAMEHYRQWNTDNPEMRIDPQQLMRSVRERVKAQAMTSEQRFLKSVPKALKPEARESLQH